MNPTRWCALGETPRGIWVLATTAANHWLPLPSMCSYPIIRLRSLIRHCRRIDFAVELSFPELSSLFDSSCQFPVAKHGKRRSRIAWLSGVGLALARKDHLFRNVRELRYGAQDRVAGEFGSGQVRKDIQFKTRQGFWLCSGKRHGHLSQLGSPPASESATDLPLPWSSCPSKTSFAPL